MKNCLNCSKEIDGHVNYCNWDCHVEHARKEGCVDHRPNGLPVRCITASGLLTECEHGDHPDYKFPVVADYIGERDDKFIWVGSEGERKPMTDEEFNGFSHETHALIYCDGSIAVTIYECCYAMWLMRDGSLAGGSLWKPKEWKLSDKSLAEIRTRFNDQEDCTKFP